ncbi:MAG: terminase, partial [Proteobacteria bacterium]|nr:terminase [Pseudomonadota bacterium]
MLSVVKKAEGDLGSWLATEWGFLTGLCHYEGEPIELEAYQLAFMQNRSRFRWITKSRQVGYSFAFALEALARCHLRDGYTAIFVSYNLEDAKEKILIARQVFEEMPLAYQKRLVTDSETELAFDSNAKGRRISRILSVP